MKVDRENYLIPLLYVGVEEGYPGIIYGFERHMF